MEKGTLKGLIFDLDGTLANTIDDLADSMNCVLTSQGYPTHKSDAYRYFVGAGMRNLVKRSLPEDKRDDTEIDKCLGLLLIEYKENCFVKTRLYDGIREAIDKLKDRGIKLAVFSNKIDELTQRFVEVLIGANKFEIVVGAQPSIPIKPNPAGAFLICEKLGIPPKEFGYIGDTSTDMLTANSAGMYSIGALWGFRTKDELVESGAKCLVSHPRELLDLF